jgi:hypothetical protein
MLQTWDSAPPLEGAATWRAGLFAMLAYALCVALLDGSFGITFESNDDVAMLMIAHGFGIAAEPSAVLPFSNVVQGHVVQALGWRFGAAGYAVYLMGALVLAGGAAVAALTALNARPWANALLVGAILLRPMLQPQFTIIAGLLAAAAALALLAHARAGGRAWLPMAAVLAVLAFLMRSQAVILILLVASPFLLQRRLLRDGAAWAAGAVALGAILAAAWWDHRHLAAPEWLPFLTLDRLRGVFTDFGMASAVAARPEVMRAVGWSTNDLTMLRNFWLVDPVMAHPDRLRQAIAAVGAGATFRLDAARAMGALAQITARDLWAAWLLFGACMLALRGPALWRALAGLALLLGVLLLLSAAGRFGIGRVYYPGLAALALLAFGSAGRAVPAWRRLLPPAGAVAAAALTLALLLPAAQARAALAADLRQQLAALPTARPLVVWGDILPFEALYPPLARRSTLPDLAIFGIGVTSLAPYGVAHWGGSIEGFIRRFASPDGIVLFAWGGGVDMLRIYCRERFGGTLHEAAVMQVGWRRHSRLSCLPADAAGPPAGPALGQPL